MVISDVSDGKEKNDYVLDHYCFSLLKKSTIEVTRRIRDFSASYLSKLLRQFERRIFKAKVTRGAGQDESKVYMDDVAFSV